VRVLNGSHIDVCQLVVKVCVFGKKCKLIFHVKFRVSRVRVKVRIGLGSVIVL